MSSDRLAGSWMRALVWTALAIGLPGVVRGQGTALATLELEGPLEQVQLDAGRRTTRIWAELGAGERRTLVAPLALPAPAGADLSGGLDRLAITILPEGAGGQASVTALELARPDLFDAPLSTLVTLRSRAPLGEPLARLDGVRVALGLATLIAVLALARRRLQALVAGGTGALLVLAWPSDGPPGTGVRVIEVDARLGQWVTVDGAPDRLEVAAGRPPFDDVLRREANAASGAAVEWWVEAASGAPARWWLVAPGQWLYAIEELGRPPRLDERENRAFALERCWVRSADGAWSARGAWALGAPLPPASEAHDPPPGWLASGLPQGVGVLLGRLGREDGGWGPGGRSGGAAWLRVTGFAAEGEGGKAVDESVDGR